MLFYILCEVFDRSMTIESSSLDTCLRLIKKEFPRLRNNDIVLIDYVPYYYDEIDDWFYPETRY